MFSIRLLGSMFNWGLAVSREAGDAVLDSCDHPAGSIVWQMEPDRVFWKMVGSARRPDGCRRRADVPAERKAMRRTALHAALHGSSFGHEVAVAGRAAGAWELVRRDERRPGGLGRLVGQHPRGHRSTLPRPPDPAFFVGCQRASAETVVNSQMFLGCGHKTPWTRIHPG